ncbi:ARM repeat-containing protein [Suhomyces tanzawaensis NRRL Y-17324]|uniref:ARM repeat-containing protein n=1 Tax=Suhomyces tanzawaensis NRRL Y-17324 TaxID=984487 RepID=A0A1E4SB92_9ASCO|nr:ARM repeat-containing protein [Suhomyces tanzawaensis NRRL Y-17324]ODV76769.1 ARM repeat-containing protein [Suhomyces tanzawaensis NRRL Y-17324]
MTANLQSRSASISTTADESSPLVKPGFGAKPSLRSASIGSSFFHKDSPGLFASANDANTSSNSVDDELAREDPPATVNSSSNAGTDSTNATDLDIVGALGNLDLDGDFGVPSKDSELGVPQFPFLYGDSSFQPQFYPYPHPHQGSVTPNPLVGSFAPSAFGPASTPSSTWNSSFVPSSAPPFAYGSGEPEAPLVRPFELPDDHHHASKDPAGSADATALHLPFSTPPPASQAHSFGGILDHKFSADGTSPESDLDSFAENKIRTSFSGPFSGSGLNGDVKLSQPLPQYHHQASQQSSHQDVPFSGLKDNLSMPLGPNMWNQHPPIMAAQMHPSNLRNNFVDNRGMSPIHGHPIMGSSFNGQAGGRFNGPNNGNNVRNARYLMNDGMNVHRKMHNNRRKGDDASKYANSKLEDFTGEIYSLCKDQHGCRFLQRQLDLGREVAEGSASAPNALTNDIAATMIFNEIYLKIIELMTDPFGNYLIQKLFENVSSDQRIILVKNASPEFIRIALDPHGTRALQKLVECITTEEESRLIIDSLSPHIVSLSRDLNGNHVVQKCLQKLKPQENQFIFDAASVNCIEIATHRHGCCVLQRCLDHGNFAQRKQLSLKVAENATTLSLDPFGNYVVQYVLSRGDEDSIKIILDHIKSNVVSLSLHKFGSNVIEKSLRINKLSDSLIEVLLKNDDKFGIMLNDAFGNYVLQTSLDVANAGQLERLSQALQPLLPNIKNTPHGRRIMTKIQSIC